MSWRLLVHGGSGSFRRETMTAGEDAAARQGLHGALEAGRAILSGGGPALDAVEAAVVALEEHESFNAGRGAVYTWDGRIELDAAIMDGRTRAAGAVTGTTATRSPVRLAARVLADGRHVLLSGKGADAFAREQGLEAAGQEWFGLAERRRQLDEIRAGSGFDSDMKYGTVGAVAVDTAGHVAAATSTGGLTAKRWGRIGDTPLIGAGTYADDRACAVSCTGAGEFFIRNVAAHEIAARVRLAGEPPELAARAVLAEVQALGGVGGVIVLAPGGEGGWHFTTPGMFRGSIAVGKAAQVAIYGDED